jgi:hypothetical protein
MTPVRFVVIFRGLLLSSINASGEALLTGASDTGEAIMDTSINDTAESCILAIAMNQNSLISRWVF